MAFEFFQEMNEARLFKDADTLYNKSADEIAKITFLMFMMLEILRHEDQSFAKSYVAKTIWYEGFDAMRSSASDLHNLLAVLNHQEKYEGKIKQNKAISVPLLQIKRYLRNIENGRHEHAQDRSFFKSLEEYFKLTDSTVRQIRRVVGDWKDASTTEKRNFRYQIKNLIPVSQRNDLVIQFRNKLQG
jgi:hypothetical protein